ncbi:hypothetical protein QE152_g4853 [Popillia japonica]|uniref:Uncharacterized protein n=1 Tax=Popillia japonica TaxID=7064 RepID=A0AAW1MWF1_POPJA
MFTIAHNSHNLQCKPYVNCCKQGLIVMTNSASFLLLHGLVYKWCCSNPTNKGRAIVPAAAAVITKTTDTATHLPATLKFVASHSERLPAAVETAWFETKLSATVPWCTRVCRLQQSFTKKHKYKSTRYTRLISVPNTTTILTLKCT